MKTWDNTRRVGLLLLAGAALLAAGYHFLGGGLITTRALPIPPPVPGRLSPVSVTETTYHWPLLVIGPAALAGLVCLLLPRRQEDTSQQA